MRLNSSKVKLRQWKIAIISVKDNEHNRCKRNAKKKKQTNTKKNIGDRSYIEKLRAK